MLRAEGRGARRELGALESRRARRGRRPPLSPFSSRGPAAVGRAEARPRGARGRADRASPTAPQSSWAAPPSPPRASPSRPPGSRSLHPEHAARSCGPCSPAAADPAGLPVARRRRGRPAARPADPRRSSIRPPRRPARFEAQRTTPATPLSLRLQRRVRPGRARPRSTSSPATPAVRHGDAERRAAARRATRSGACSSRRSTGGLAASFPWAVPGGDAPSPCRSGALELERGPGDRVRGVRFALGALRARRPARAARQRDRARRRGSSSSCSKGTAASCAASRRRAARASCCPPSTPTRCRRARCAASTPGTLPLPRDGPRAAPAPRTDGRSSEPSQPMRTVTLYGRPGCHLCDDARAVAAARCARTRPFALEEVDIDDRRRAPRALPGADPGRRARRRGAVRLLRGRGRADGAAASGD